MKEQSTHNKLITLAAREILRPMGITQKGRSRTWLDDHGWWLVLIEFQPSGWSRGTYLNVGAHWLWSGTDYLSFDLGHRVENFAEYIDDTQFAEAVYRMARRAASETQKYRTMCSSISSVADLLSSNPNPAGWQLFHAGVACGLSGQKERARSLFTKLAAETSVVTEGKKQIKLDWHIRLKARATELSNQLHHSSSFKSTIIESIIQTRKTLHLKDWNGIFIE